MGNDYATKCRPVVPAPFLFGMGKERSSAAVKMNNGTVKWFSALKDYGFIAGDDGKDAMLHDKRYGADCKL